jgi:hypothetical protein
VGDDGAAPSRGGALLPAAFEAGGAEERMRTSRAVDADIFRVAADLDKSLGLGAMSRAAAVLSILYAGYDVGCMIKLVKDTTEAK